MALEIYKRVLKDTNKFAIVQLNFSNPGGPAIAPFGASAQITATGDLQYAITGQTTTIGISNVLFTMGSGQVYSVGFGVSGGGVTGRVFLNGQNSTEFSIADLGFVVTNPLTAGTKLNGGDIWIRNEVTLANDSFTTIVVEVAKTSGYRAQ